MWRVLNGEAVAPQACPKLFQVYSVRRRSLCWFFPNPNFYFWISLDPKKDPEILFSRIKLEFSIPSIMPPSEG